MPTESQFLAFQGLRVHFRVVEPEGQLRHRLFILSSPLTSTFNWRKLLPELSQLGCLMVLMDLPGFGESDCGPAVPQSNEMRSHMAWGVLDELDHQRGEGLALWHLMGHGVACQTILTMANEYPDSVRSHIHVAPTLESAILPRQRRTAAGPSKADERWYARNIASAEGPHVHGRRAPAAGILRRLGGGDPQTGRHGLNETTRTDLSVRVDFFDTNS